MTVVFKFHPEFCRGDTGKGTDTDFDKVIMARILTKLRLPSSSRESELVSSNQGDFIYYNKWKW